MNKNEKYVISSIKQDDVKTIEPQYSYDNPQFTKLELNTLQSLDTKTVYNNNEVNKSENYEEFSTKTTDFGRF